MNPEDVFESRFGLEGILPPVDVGDATTETDADSLPSEDPEAGLRDARDAIRTALEVNGPLGAGLAQFQLLRDTLESTLDLMQVESNMLCDAVDLAVDQVQDMRIAWAEDGPETDVSDILLQVVLLAVAEVAVAKIAADLIRRGLRTWARRQTSKAIASVSKEARRGNLALTELATKRKELEKLALFHATSKANLPDLSKVPIDQRTSVLGRSLAARKAARSAQPALQVERDLDDARRAIEVLDREVAATDKALEELQKRLAQVSTPGAVDNDQLKEMVGELVAEPLLNAIPDVASILGKTVKGAGDKLLPVASGSLRDRSSRAKEAKDVPTFSQRGAGPSALIRLQMLQLYRSSDAEISRLRREALRLAELVSSAPELGLASALTIALAAIRTVVVRLAEPPLRREEYQVAVQELALEIEFCIWSLLLPIYLDQMRITDLFSSVDVPGFLLFVRNAPKRVVKYLTERFHAEYDESEGVNDVDKLVGAMQKRRKAMQAGNTVVRSTLIGTSDRPAARTTRPAVLRPETAEGGTPNSDEAVVETPAARDEVPRS